MKKASPQLLKKWVFLSLSKKHVFEEERKFVSQLLRKFFYPFFFKVYFGTYHARVYLFADFLGINCATGMSTLMRKNLLDEVGGIAAFAQYLAEDYFFAKSFADR